MQPVGGPINSELMQPTLEKSEVTRLATLLFDHIEGQIKSADSKAWLTVAANTLLANVFKDLNTRMVYKLWNSPNFVERVSSFFIVLMFVSLLGSIFYALWVVKPTLSAPIQQSLFYFGNIKQQREEDFINKFQKQRLDEICRAILAQVYTKAKIANRKFIYLNNSLYLFFVALLCGALAQFFIAFMP